MSPALDLRQGKSGARPWSLTGTGQSDIIKQDLGKCTCYIEDVMQKNIIRNMI